MTQDRLWELLAKKLSGEASLPELEELQALLRKSPDLHYPLQTITDLWFLHPAPTEDVQAAYERHLSRMQDHFGDWQAAEEAAAEPGSATEPFPEQQTPAAEAAEPGSTIVLSQNTPTVSPGNDVENDPEPDPALRHRRRRRLGWASLAIAAMVGAGLWFGEPFRQKQAEAETETANPCIAEVSTRNGSKSKVQLPDGSQVWLNSGSKLTYGKDFNGTLREVNLTGEAYFDVVKNPGKPFIIHARNIDIRVVGTAFNVKSYPGDKTTETSLIRGIIEVNIRNRPAEKIILKPNEKLVVAADDLPVVKQALPATAPRTRPAPQVVIDNISYLPADSTVVETSWMDNKLIFRDESFRELADRMERWYGVSIVFDNKQLEDIRLTGTFQGETLQQALRALTITASFTYKINKEVVTISNKP